VDRRFDRERFDQQGLVDAFAERVRSDVDQHRCGRRSRRRPIWLFGPQVGRVAQPTTDAMNLLPVS
jgi:hypothetical protein